MSLLGCKQPVGTKQLVVFGEGKAFLRHHINALSDVAPVAGSSLPSEVA